MKSTFKTINSIGKLVRSQLFYCLVFFLGLAIANQVVIIPIFRFLMTLILQMALIPLLSYQNILTILLHHPLAAGFMLLELIALLLVIYFEFALTLWFIRDLREGDFGKLKRQFRLSVTNLRLSSLPLLLFYTLLILPFASVFFRTPLLAKVKIPEFILDYLTRSPWMFSLFLVLWLLLAYLGIRYVLTLPLMVMKGYSARAALKSSWQLTRRQFKALLGKIIALTIFNSFLSIMLITISYLLQAGFDHWAKPWAMAFAIINLLLVQLAIEILSIFSTIVAISFLLPLLEINDSIIIRKIPSSKKLKLAFGITASLLTIFYALNALLYFTKFEQTRPLIISHRGVSQENGVQNTIPALKLTHKLHPDYVELDVHETKDHNFVVMHDENYKTLTGVNKKPIELTLSQATQLTATENGHKAKLASFDDYLKTANNLHQKLLIEVKTTRFDSAGMLKRFNQLYSKNILKHGHLLQSLDYNAVEQLKEINSKLKVYYIQPYNLSYPNSVADGFSMEYSTMNEDFVVQAHFNNKPVFTWDMNEDSTIMRMLYYGVDGLITDNVQLARQVSQEYLKTSNYADQILNFVAFKF